MPPELWGPACPFRTLRESEYPSVSQWLVLFARWQRYRLMPEAGGLDEQPEPVLRAFDLMSYALTLPPVHLRE